MAKFSPDQFDDLPAGITRVGAHRGPRKRGRGWIAFAWAALATIVLIVAGLFTLSRIDPNYEFALPSFGGAPEETAVPTSTPTPTAEPVTDPAAVPEGLALDISVLNASGVDDVEDAAGDTLEGAGWPDPSRANAEATTDETTIYYWSAEYEGIARGLAETLGVPQNVELSDAYVGAPLTIVLGADYTPAG